MAIKRITTNLIKDSDIATVDIANNAITAAKITDGNITTAKLADLSVTAGKLAGTLDLTGKTITVATATTGDNDTSPASTAFVQQEIAALVDSSPDSLNTLNELAAALGDDASFSTTVTNSIATKLPLAGGTLTGALVVTADANPALEISRGSANTTNVNLKYNTTLTGQLSAANAEFQISAAGSSTPMEFFTNGSERMRIDSSGNLGLGTNSPNSYSNQTTLTINGATYGRLDIESSNTLRASLFATAGSATLYTTTGVLSFDTSGGEAMRIDANGQVMISHTSSFAHSDADNLAIGDGTNNSGLTIYTGASKESSIIFGNAGTNGNIEAGIKYYHESHGTVANRRAMTFATGGSMAERMRIDSSGDVLIGSSTNLNVLNGTPKIQVGDGSGHASIQWYSGTGSVAGLYFGDASSGSARYEGYIEYRHNSNQMAFRTQGNDVFYINSTGHVGVGTSNADARLTVNGSANSEQMIITGNGNVSRGLSISTAATGGQQDATVIFNAQDTENVAYPAMKFQTGGGDILRFHHQSIINNARVGLTYPCELMFNGEYTAGQQDVALEAGHAARIEFLKDDFFRIQGSASVSAGAGVSYADKLKVNIDSGGILFGSDTAAANTLNDYEEGTWTPTFGGASLSTATGSYTKIGDQVTVHFRVITTGGLPGSTGQVQVGNLPFTIGTGFGGVGGLYVGPSNVSSATGGGGTIVPYVTGGESFIRFLNVDTGTFGYTIWGELEVSSNNVVTAIGTVTYQV